MLTLVIGDKNLSSWSLRPWLLMKQAAIPFTERLVRLDRPETKREIAKYSPSGRVPCLIDGETAIPDSLAIAEYLAEKFSDKALWPADARARAIARSVSAEMHSGFAALRAFWPMNFSREGMAHLTSGIDGDIARIGAIFESCRREFGQVGPFLFGRFSIADAMYAPVVSRFQTYGPVTLPPLADEWRKTMWALPAMREWGKGAIAELGA
jgi:glutathione S-transferase